MARKVKAYRLLEANSPDSLSELINEELGKGWFLYRGPKIAVVARTTEETTENNAVDIFYYQTLVRYAD